MSGSAIARRRVAIVGTREPTFEQRCAISTLVATLPSDVVVVSGACRGVDKVAVLEADLRGLAVVEYPADWGTHGKAAGFIRNQVIVDNCDEVHAFPGAGNGTWDTIRRAKKAGKKVTVHQ